MGKFIVKQFVIVLLSLNLFITACGQALTGIVTSVPTFQNTTSTPSSVPTITITTTATQSPAPTITSLPTIPTFTPTFDASTIVTVTPAQEAECPEIDSAIKVENYLPRKLEYPSPNTT